MAPDRPHRATLTFSYPDEALASTVERAVRLDAGDIDGDRSRAAVSSAGTVLEVTIEATDPTALRAAKRTWCGLVEAAERTAATARPRTGAGDSLGTGN